MNVDKIRRHTGNLYLTHAAAEMLEQVKPESKKNQEKLEKVISTLVEIRNDECRSADVEQGR